MGQISFEDEECNAWGLFDKTAIVADNSNNLHVAEVAISVDQNGKKTYKLNRYRKTVCGKAMKSPQNPIPFYSDSDSAVRLKLARLQNEGTEVCGICVAHFHLDK